jgi:DNA relaxase NicK
MENYCEKVNAKSKRKTASWKPTPKDAIIRIGSRQSSNYYRVYEKNNGLEFELEMKKKVVKSVQELLFSEHLKEFEGKLVKHF